MRDMSRGIIIDSTLPFWILLNAIEIASNLGSWISTNAMRNGVEIDDEAIEV